MKWFTGINERGLPVYIEHLRASISSAIEIGGLTPHILFDGEPSALFRAIGRDDVTVHNCRTGLWRDIQSRPNTGTWNAEVAAGAYLRMEIPHIEHEDEFVLYTDSDVLFTRKVRLEHIKPKFAAAAIEPTAGGHKYRCSGVLVLNVPAMRREYDDMLSLARKLLGTVIDQGAGYDQDVYNTYLEDKWDPLPLEAHWKPFWGANRSACIVHFIGPKFEHIRSIASGTSGLPASHVLCYLYGQNPIGCRFYAKVGEYFAKADISAVLRGKLMLLGAPLYASRFGWLAPV